jgi:hypothetical protein
MKNKVTKQAHTSDSKIGMGDSYGQGMRNPVGKMRDDMMMGKPKKRSNKAPRSLA